MPVTPKRAADLALAMEAATSRPHFDRTAFRTPRKTFCTLANDGSTMNFMFDPDTRDFYCEQAPEAFSPAPGGWGRMGATQCVLKDVDLATYRSALAAAHELALPKPKAPRRRKPEGG